MRPPDIRDFLPAPPPAPPLPRFLVQRRETEDELFSEYIRSMEEALGRDLTPEEETREWTLWKQSVPTPLPKPRLTREDVRVEVWEERDRLHIGIQEEETGRYIVSWWDDEAREMFDQGFFKRGRLLKESVLDYAESVGLLAKENLLPQTQLPQTNPQTFAPPAIDAELDRLLEAKKGEWEARGYRPQLIGMATNMAREWPAQMLASTLYKAVRGTPVEREVARSLYRLGIDVADRWLEAMSK